MSFLYLVNEKGIVVSSSVKETAHDNAFHWTLPIFTKVGKVRYPKKVIFAYYSKVIPLLNQYIHYYKQKGIHHKDVPDTK